MSDYSEDSDESSSESAPADEMPYHGAYVAKPYVERQDHAKFSKKIPPSFDGRSSWFTYEDSIDDWVELTDEPQQKHGIMLKQRLIHDAEHFKSLLETSKLKQPDGVKYLKDTIRPTYVKGAQQIYLWRFLTLIKMERQKKLDLLYWIPRVQKQRKRCFAAWMDCLTQCDDKDDQKYRSWVRKKNTARSAAPAASDEAEDDEDIPTTEAPHQRHPSPPQRRKELQNL